MEDNQVHNNNKLDNLPIPIRYRKGLATLSI